VTHRSPSQRAQAGCYARTQSMAACVLGCSDAPMLSEPTFLQLGSEVKYASGLVDLKSRNVTD
jgi:hypothetical protein